MKWFGSRLRLTFFWSWSGSKLFAKVISTGQKLLLARKELKSHCLFFSQPSSNGGICTAGNYCPEGSAVETPCIAGQYCSIDGLHQPEGDCDEGYYCPVGSNHSQMIDCSYGHYCPLGTGAPIPCRNGTYGPSLRLKEEAECIDCDAGYYCNGTGLFAVTAECDAG